MNRNEVVGGITTFLAMVYIVAVNPIILSKTGMPFDALVTTTVLVAAISSILMGAYANNPIALAPGMGLNAFFTFTICLGMNIDWKIALGLVFWSGVIFLVMSLFNLREKIVKAIPTPLKFAISVGIGLFIALIGFTNAKFVIDNPATLLGAGKLGPELALFILSIIFTGIMVIKKVKGALLYGMILTTLLAIPFGRMFGAETLVVWRGLFSKPNFSLFFQADILGSFKLAYLPLLFTFVFTDLFDSLSTFIGVSEAADLKDEDGQPINVKRSLIVDSISTLISGLFGSSPGTSYIESAAGVQAGGRTGMTSIVTGLCFLPCLFLAPLIGSIPAIATAPILVLVGCFMLAPISKINWSKFDEAIPCFLGITLIPFTYSITNGIVWGFLSWCLIRVFTGRVKELPITLIVISTLSIFVLLGH